MLDEKMIKKDGDGRKVMYSIKKDEILNVLEGQAINLKDMFQVTTTIEQESIEETHAMLVDAISRKDDSTVRAISTVSKSTGILKDLLNKTVPMKHEDGQGVTCTLLDYAKLCKNSEAVEEILKVDEELEDIPNEETAIGQQIPPLTVVIEAASNIECDKSSEKARKDNATNTENKGTAVIYNTEAMLTKHEDINENSEIEVCRRDAKDVYIEQASAKLRNR
ncbi:WD_0033/WD_0034 family tandem repeat-containing protein [Wolbachia endosymbiont of Atemnus politus]|uniref:WD_0033/WD_0034 family tandem repeat-containing protein n=1 Tax=Wolbachia endosymbiont of Atemnus politus TaxID=2682840 RepID=UPI001C552A4C|nr:hypothetical protein [Wolbachia endosymbiont of Atemnus politus]